MYFENPEILVALLLFIPLVVIFRNYLRVGKKLSVKYSSLNVIKESSTENKLRKYLPFILLTAILSLTIIGLADPHIPLENLKEGVNVVMVIDNSGSMAAQDYYPTRLDAAKNAAEILLKNLEKDDHVGIVIFETGAMASSYLTPFKEKTMRDLSAISQREGATVLGDGLVLGVEMATSIPNKKKVVIVLSDGEYNSGIISPQEAIEYSKLKEIQVHTIGLGSEEPVFVAVSPYGGPLYTELDEETLIAIAKETGGNYYKSVDSKTLNEIFSNISEDIDRELEDVSIQNWFFATTAALVMANIYLIYGKYRIAV